MRHFAKLVAERLVLVIGPAYFVLVHESIEAITDVEKAFAQSHGVVRAGDHPDDEVVFEYFRVLEVVRFELVDSVLKSKRRQ